MFGSKKWSFSASHFPGRAGKQCRERWLNHLDTSVSKADWSSAEDAVLVEQQELLGNKWSEIAKILPGRSENAVKNRFNSILSRRVGKAGKGGGGGGGGKKQQQQQQVRRSKERSDELVTLVLGTKTSRACTSIRDAPPS